jgi:hypothetical protein
MLVDRELSKRSVAIRAVGLSVVASRDLAGVDDDSHFDRYLVHRVFAPVAALAVEFEAVVGAVRSEARESIGVSAAESAAPDDRVYLLGVFNED